MFHEIAVPYDGSQPSRQAFEWLEPACRVTLGPLEPAAARLFFARLAAAHRLAWSAAAIDALARASCGYPRRMRELADRELARASRAGGRGLAGALARSAGRGARRRRHQAAGAGRRRRPVGAHRAALGGDRARGPHPPKPRRSAGPAGWRARTSASPANSRLAAPAAASPA